MERVKVGSHLFSIKGKTALITGGSRGIGAMIAQAYCAAGARVYLAARKADEMAAVVSSVDGHCVPIVADLATIDGVRGLTESFATHEARLDILVNNAGATWGAPIETFPESGWDKVMDLNVKAMFFLTQALLPQLRSAADPENPARVINISSANALRYSHMDNFSYSTSKAAIAGLTRALAVDLGGRLRVNAIHPAAIRTPMLEAGFAGQSEDRRLLDTFHPAGRIGEPEEVARVAVFLASESSGFLTGSCFGLDGALSARLHDPA